jgi:hypothetical protein
MKLFVFPECTEGTLRPDVRATKLGGKMLLLALSAMFLMVGCAGPQVGPRYIDQITSSQKSVKLLYRQQVGAQTKRGLIECDRADDGSLNNCQNINIHFQE